MVQTLKKDNKGFTLVELLVVVAILGILAVVLVPQYIQYVERSRQATDFASLEEIRHAADVELALLDTAPANNDTLYTFTVSNTGTITPDATTPGSLASKLNTVIGQGKLKSAKSAGTYTLIYSSSAAAWNSASQTKINALKAGTAS